MFCPTRIWSGRLCALALLVMLSAKAWAQDAAISQPPLPNAYSLSAAPDAVRAPPATEPFADRASWTTSASESIPECGDCPPGNGWLDNLSFFAGLDGSKQPQDFGVNAQFGGRASVNWGIPLFESLGIGAQIGTAIDATGDAVQVVQRTLGSSGRTQSYTTLGIYQRTEMGLSWGVVYDFLSQGYYDQFALAQWRVNVGYQLTERDLVGVWSAIADRSSNGNFGAIPVTLTPITQTNAYYRHEWINGIQTTGWCGLANEHGQVNAVLGDLAPLHDTFVFGAELYVPLTNNLALFGQGNFIMPASSGTVDAYLGVAWYPHGGVRQMARALFAPLQTVAAPTNFAVNLHR